MEDKLSKVLHSAAETPALRDALLNNRKETVAGLDLNDAEKAVLLSVSDEQLKKMIDAARRFWKRPAGRATKIAIVGGAAILAASLCLPSLGTTPETSYERRAVRGLQQITAAEQLYRNAYGMYGSIDSLRNDKETKEIMDSLLESAKPYKFIVTTDGKTYSATAEHETRSNTRPSFRVGPDGEIKKLDPSRK